MDNGSIAVYLGVASEVGFRGRVRFVSRVEAVRRRLAVVLWPYGVAGMGLGVIVAAQAATLGRWSTFPWAVGVGLVIAAAVVIGILLRQRQTALEFETRDRDLFATGRGSSEVFVDLTGVESQSTRAFGAGVVHLYVDRAVGVSAVLVPDGGRPVSREVRELDLVVTRRGTIVDLVVVHDGREHRLVLPRGRICAK